MRDVHSQTDSTNLPPSSRHCLWLLASSIVGVAIAWPALQYFLSLLVGAVSQSGFTINSQLMQDLGLEGVVLFKQHDRNNDGVLTLEEFEPLAHRLLDIKASS
jgi:hypothetical protein